MNSTGILSDTAIFDTVGDCFFGKSIAFNNNGDIVIIGDPNNTINGHYSGQIKVYKYIGTNWIQIGQNIDGETETYKSGFSVAINNSGTIIAIGDTASTYATSLPNRGYVGQVKIYSFNGTNWVQLGQTIKRQDAGISDEFGISISLNSAGDRIAIGSDGYQKVLIYSFNGTNWVQLGSDITWTVGAPYTPKEFGRTLCLNDSGNRVVIGDYRCYIDNNSGRNPGLVEVFEYNGSSWGRLGQSIIGDTESTELGFKVLINSTGDRILIGSPYSDTSTGRTRTYSYNGSSWVQLGSDLVGPSTFKNFGYQISMNNAGDIIAVTVEEAIKTYSYNGSSWVQLGSDIITPYEQRLNVEISLNGAGDRLATSKRPINFTIGFNPNGDVRMYSYNGSNWVQLGQTLTSDNRS